MTSDEEKALEQERNFVNHLRNMMASREFSLVYDEMKVFHLEEAIAQLMERAGMQSPVEDSGYTVMTSDDGVDVEMILVHKTDGKLH